MGRTRRLVPALGVLALLVAAVGCSDPAGTLSTAPTSTTGAAASSGAAGGTPAGGTTAGGAATGGGPSSSAASAGATGGTAADPGTTTTTTAAPWLDALCYGPYRDNEDPNHAVFPTTDEMRQDLEYVSSLTGTIRTYGSAGILQEIPRLCEAAGLDCYAGAWLSTKLRDNDREIRGLIEVAAERLECLKGLVVGNEVLLRGDLSEDQLISYIKQVEAATDIPVGTADDIEQWLAHPRLAEAVEIIFVHIHPYWKGVGIEEAAAYVVQRWDEIRARYPGKAVVIGETGWPSGGDVVGAAVPSDENQRRFIADFVAQAAARGVDYCYFDIFDETWKAPQTPAGQEKPPGQETPGAAPGYSSSYSSERWLLTGAEGGAQPGPEAEGHWGICDTGGAVKARLQDLVPAGARDGMARAQRVLTVIKAALPWSVYTDYDPEGCHFYPSGWMGSIGAISLDDACAGRPHSGATCTQISFSPGSKDEWAGVYWQYPLNNWGEYPGYDVSGAKSLTFWARGETGGEKAEFKVGGIAGEHSDSLQPAVSTGVVKLTAEWKPYAIDVAGMDLSQVIGAFCWVTSTAANPHGCTIYVDDIAFTADAGT